MQRYGHIVILLCLFLQPLWLPAQNITGLWKGVLHNDTTGKDLRYEIAISEYRGKLSGYSHTFFIVDDQEYYGVKKVKVRVQEDKILVEDQELIANNFPILPAKGVHQLNILTLETHDNIMILSGPFATNRTKEYHTLTGSIRLQKKDDFWQSALVPHLQELGLVKELSFVELEKPVEIRSIARTEPVVISQPELRTKTVVKTESVIQTRPAKNEPIARTESRVVPQPAEIKSIARAEPMIIRQPEKKTNAVVKPEPVIRTQPDAIKPIEVAAIAPEVKGPAAEVSKRKIETIQSVYYKTDSLVLTLYDNGEVDGDTVSVLMNGKVIMPMVGLSTKAVRKTIRITPETPDSIQLIMYAENLGSIPPNTGLLVVHDGKDIYEIRFSGDMEKNAAIVFRRKK